MDLACIHSGNSDAYLACHSDTEELIICSILKQASIERRRMSKRLNDDALAYFDECVSLSTFDGSDFSSLEETPPIHQVPSTTEVGDGTPQVSSSVSFMLSICFFYKLVHFQNLTHHDFFFLQINN